MKWSKEEIEKTIELINSGFNYKQIGEKLNRSRDSVKNKLNELGYTFNKEVNKKQFWKENECLQCLGKFQDLIIRDRKFCSKSCSVIYNNTGKIKTQKIKDKISLSLSLTNNKDNITYIYVKPVIKKCLFCNKENNCNKSIYCSIECCGLHRKLIIKEKIESGDLTQSPKQYKKYLIEKHGEKCMACGWDKINPYSNKVPIELEHIDGNSENNNLDNLKLLCPNCHSLTPTYKALNVGNGRHSRRERYKNGKSF